MKLFTVKLKQDIFHCSCVLLLVCICTFRGATEQTQIPQSCIYTKVEAELEARVFEPCELQLNKCIENRQVKLVESQENSKDYCWHRPLSSDPQFLGPCPKHMAELENSKYDGEETLIDRLRMRYEFGKYIGEGDSKKKDVIYKSRESQKIIDRLLSEDPEDFKLLSLHQLYSWSQSSKIEKFNFVLNRFEREPDCPWTLWRVPDSAFVYLYEITENWLLAEGKGSQLSEAELVDLIERVRSLVLSSYDKHMLQSDSEDYLYWAAASLEDGVLGAYDKFQGAYSKLGIKFENYVTERRVFLIDSIWSEFGLESDHSRTHSLRMICNGYAFRIGLLEHCIHLLNHFGKHDAVVLEFPANDWSHAALLLVDGLTWDCTEHDSFYIYYPGWGHETPCLADSHQFAISDIESLLSEFPSIGEEAKTQLLLGYLALDERSDEHFLRALAIDDHTVVFAARLAKRLLKRNKIQTASNIVSSIDSQKKDHLEKDEQQFLEWTTNAVLIDKKYRNYHEKLIGMF